MSLKKNIVANYSSQIIIIIVSVITLPKLIIVMGAEAYGLIGFFTLMQSWLMLLDLGMSPTLTREIARFNGGAINAFDLIHFFRSMKKIFIALAVGVIVIVLICSNFIATSWLKTKLDYFTVMQSIAIMAFILAVRWIITIYRAVFTGFEKLVWLGIINSTSAIFRFIGVFVALIYFGNSPIVFFLYQLLISVFELIILLFYVRDLIPRTIIPINYKLRPLKEVLGFSLTIAFTGAVWVIVTQTDKLILSKILQLSEYGYYSLAVQVAGGITLIGGPISSAILPRLTKLESQKKENELIALYRQSTRIIVVIAGTASLILIFFSKQLIFAWTGNIHMVDKVFKYVILYSIGNFFLVIAAFPYYLQYAKGNLKLHLYGNIAYVIFLIPSLIIVVNKFGGIGAGYVWIATNSLYLFLWVPFINHFFIKGLNRVWYFNDILSTYLPATLIAWLLSHFLPIVNDRLLSIAQIISSGIIIVIFCLVFSGEWKNLLLIYKRNR